MVSSCFSVGKNWNHLESCGLLSSLAGDVSNSETGWAVEVCSFYPLHARHSVGPEESYEDESEEDEVSNKGGWLNQEHFGAWATKHEQHISTNEYTWGFAQLE